MSNFKISEVIFVDDDAIIRMVGSKLLRSIGYDGVITNYENGKIAIENVKERFDEKKFGNGENPILLFLDINMPIMDGWGFLDDFSAFPNEFKSHFKITIITSSISPIDKDKAFSYADLMDYIQKPLSAKHLQDFLTEHDLLEESK